MKKYILNKYLDRSQTINNIVFIVHCIGAHTEKLVLNHVGAVLTILSVIFIIQGLKAKRKDDSEKDYTMSSFIHAIIFCIAAMGFYGLVLLHHYGYLNSITI